MLIRGIIDSYSIILEVNPRFQVQDLLSLEISYHYIYRDLTNQLMEMIFENFTEQIRWH